MSLLAVSALSLLAILGTHGPGSEADAQAPAATKVGTAKLDALALAHVIDQDIRARLTREGVPAAARAGDAEFLRRVYLDLTGRVPAVEKVIAFLDSKDANKRARVVEELLADPRYGQWLAETWTKVMVPRESNNRRLPSKPLVDWLAAGFQTNKRWDKLVHELLTATGEQDKNGAVTYFIGNNSVDKITDSVTRLFLGVRLECAQCHNHPFTSYKRNEYWGMAQFFMNVRLTVNPNQAKKKGVSPGIYEDGRARKKKKGLPDSARIVPAKFLEGDQPKLNPAQPYRPVLAQWLASADNPFFARAMVNKLWGHFFGRGLVNPVDDMHADNPASHPELLAALAEQFKRSGFDVKYLIRAIVNSDTYQRTSRPLARNASDHELFSHMAVRALTPEQLYDSLTSVVGPPGRGVFPKKQKKVGAKKGPFAPRDQFVTFFHIEGGGDPLEYQAGIPQALRLMNAPLLNNTGPVVNQALTRGGKNPARVVSQLYLAILSRRPTPDELQRRLAYVARQAEPRSAYMDLAWALLNSSEFALNH